MLYVIPKSLNLDFKAINKITDIFEDLLDLHEEGTIELTLEHVIALRAFTNCFDIIELVPKKRVPWSSVISEYKNETIYYNPKKYFQMSENNILGNIVHESFHHLGYGHAYKYNKERKYSIPYFFGHYVDFKLNYPESNYNEFIEFLYNVIK